MAIARAGYVGAVRTDRTNLNVAAAVDPDALKRTDSPADAIDHILRDAGLQALPSGPAEQWRGTLPMTRASKRLVAARIFLLGDAAGYVEPFTGEGMAWAIASATSVVAYALRSLHDWDEQNARQWEAIERRKVARDQLFCRILAGLLRRPSATRVALGALSVMPALATPIVRRIHSGRVKLQASMS
jgi:flavin-dependent dehydrogenase